MGYEFEENEKCITNPLKESYNLIPSSSTEIVD